LHMPSSRMSSRTEDGEIMTEIARIARSMRRVQKALRTFQGSLQLLSAPGCTCVSTVHDFLRWDYGADPSRPGIPQCTPDLAAYRQS
jgi:hypothetical protein